MSLSQTTLSDARRRKDALALLLGMALTLVIGGYQFGRSNHTVYLLDALRRENPRILANDWYAAHTTQYHGAFAVLTAGLDRLHILRPGFLAGYLLLVALLHLGWLRLALLLGGERGIYLLSVLLYHVSAAGFGLGMYQFMQDSCFIPSNIANVAMLWGVYFLVARKALPAALSLGLAGLFHLNHAAIALALWPIFMGTGFAWIWSFFILFTLCCLNIFPTAMIVFAKGAPLPLDQFVQLYVRLRHPHHYDPSSWPVLLWVSFLWPIPLAIIAYGRGEKTLARRRTARMNLVFLTILILALIFAGVFYVSAPVIQMSLYRFSIYPKLLTCLGAAFLLNRLVPRQAVWAALIAIGIGGMVVRAADSPILHIIPEDDADYLAVCDFAREHTPIDAIFLVPPSEQEFRLRAQRAIVINFKGVPQLSQELPEWRDRLQAVLGMNDLMALPRGFGPVMKEIAARYDARPAEALVQAAHQYHAAYLVSTHELAGLDPKMIVFAWGKYRLYDLSRKESHVDAQQLRQLLRTQSGIRVGPRTAEYAARQLLAGQNAFPLMGGDARTGIAVSQAIDPAKLKSEPLLDSPAPR